MPTLAGLRRRGVTPEAIRAFWELMGVAKSNTRVDIAKLEYAIRDDLNQRARRACCACCDRCAWSSRTGRRAESRSSTRRTGRTTCRRQGTRPLPFSRELYIERDDFMEDPPKGFFRLAPGPRGAAALRATSSAATRW
jgi:glutaminyl-tRNA synthetase